MFSVPPPANVPVDGSSQEHPLKLEGVTKVDFKNFQGLFLPMYVVRHTLLSAHVSLTYELMVAAGKVTARLRVH
jgi:hypothetical protein